MILIGQFDSPFVRRVGIALKLYRIPFEHRPWSTFGDAGKIRPYNPLTRVPTLVLDDGEVLIDTFAILDYLDERVGPSRALIAESGPERRRALKVCALASGLADKAVSLIYERGLHTQTSQVWIDRCRAQIGAGFDALEAERSGRASPWWSGDSIGHGDIAVACVIRLTREVHADLFDFARWSALLAHAERCEARPEFQEISQPFAAPARA